MSKILELTQGNFEQEVLKSEGIVLVDFWAPWCGPCKMMIPILEELSADLQGTVKIAKVNVDDGDNSKLAEKYDVRGIPDMKLFKGGEIIATFIGAKPKESLLKDIKSFLES